MCYFSFENLTLSFPIVVFSLYLAARYSLDPTLDEKRGNNFLVFNFLSSTSSSFFSVLFRSLLTFLPFSWIRLKRTSRHGRKLSLFFFLSLTGMANSQYNDARKGNKSRASFHWRPSSFFFHLFTFERSPILSCMILFHFQEKSSSNASDSTYIHRCG